MIGVDSNVIFSATEPRDSLHTQASAQLEAARQNEVLVIAPVVYAKLMASTVPAFMQAFLERVHTGVLWDMPPEVWKGAGFAFGAYARARRKGQLPRRLVADFLIGAHAEYYSLAVLAFDDTVFRAAFPKVRLVSTV